MSVHRWAALVGLMSSGAVACSPAPVDPAGVGPAAPGGDGAAPAIAAPGATTPGSPRGQRVEARPLAPDERRMAVFVLPGDASVEVDGQLVQRRDGVIELTGRPGDLHKLRVFDGSKSTDEITVTIQEAGAPPLYVDLDAPRPSGSSNGGKKNPRYGFDD